MMTRLSKMCTDSNLDMIKAEYDRDILNKIKQSNPDYEIAVADEIPLITKRHCSEF